MANYDLASGSAPAASSLTVGDIIDCSYCGAVKSLTLPAGLYKLECWGAAGGDFTYSNNANYSGEGGKGGYAVGFLSLTDSSTTIYMRSGGTGTAVTGVNTNSGGGWNGGGNARVANAAYQAKGGGGGSDIRVGSDSLQTRIIVAGGGGAGFYKQGSAPYDSKGGAGGGTSGVNGNYYNSTSYMGGGGGSQTGAGISYYQTTNVSANTSYLNPAGSFGTPGTPTSNLAYCGGAGGGWYPGGYSYHSSSGGGSGYVYTSETATNYPGTKPATKYYLKIARTIDGNTSFPSPAGGNEVGHAGNGHTRITVMGNAIYDLATSAAPAATAIHIGDIIMCSYVGAYKSVSLPIGQYKLECWGAQGGSAFNNDANSIGGKGGYATGILTLDTVTTAYLYTGGKGNRGFASVGLVTGGWNGGGAGCITTANNNSYSKGSGGGASDIRIGGTTLNDRIIVAGGGGGATYGNLTYIPGAGGGIVGQDGKQWSYAGGTGGSATAKGTSYYNGTAGNATYLTEAAFGTGGAAKTTGCSCAGGGGGWYGGGASASSAYSCGSAGGGSGHVYTSLTANDYPSTKPATKYYLGSASTTADMQSGNGVIMITVLAAYQSATIPTLSNTSKTYNGSAQSPTESNYDTTKMTRSGTFSATMPGTYNVTYSLKDGYVWSDGTFTSKTYAWTITSNWRRVQAFVYDNTI